MGGGPYGGPTIPAVEGTTRTSSCSSPCCTLQARDALFTFLGCRNMVASPRGGGIRHQIMYIAEPALPLVPAIAWRGDRVSKPHRTVRPGRSSLRLETSLGDAPHEVPRKRVISTSLHASQPTARRLTRHVFAKNIVSRPPFCIIVPFPSSCFALLKGSD